jgi:FAD/FMN-containing dehydrogenase
MRLVPPDGSVFDVDADRDPETMAAAQVSIGTLGVISTITLQAVSAYNLKESLWREDFESCMERHDDLAAHNRHFSLFWCPVAESRHLYCLPDVSAVSAVKREHDVCEMKVMNLTDEPPTRTRRLLSVSLTVRKFIRLNTSQTFTNSNTPSRSRAARRPYGKFAS